MTADRPRMMRLFVAVELPQAWLDTLADVQTSMQGAIEKEETLSGVKLRWTRPEGIHLTLKFIGEVPPERLEPITTQLGHAVPAVPELTLSLDRAGSFEDRRAPHVVWAGVRDDPPRTLQKLAGDIDTWLSAVGIPGENRAFRPHLTLARMPDGLSERQRRRAAEVTAGVPMPAVSSFSVEGVSLMQSFLGPGGARYERLGRWPI